MIYITYKVNNVDNSKLISGVFARTKRSTIGDKIVETLFSNVVTWRSKQSTPLHFLLHSKLGCLDIFLAKYYHRPLFYRVLAL